MSKLDQLISMLGDLTGAVHRVADAVENLNAPAVKPDKDSDLENPWMVAVWCVDRGVKINSFYSDGPPSMGHKFVIDGLNYEVIATDVDAQRKLARVRVERVK